MAGIRQNGQGEQLIRERSRPGSQGVERRGGALCPRAESGIARKCEAHQVAADFAGRKHYGMNVEIGSAGVRSRNQCGLGAGGSSAIGVDEGRIPRAGLRHVQSGVEGSASYTGWEADEGGRGGRDAGVPRLNHAAMNVGDGGVRHQPGEVRLDSHLIGGGIERDDRRA